MNIQDTLIGRVKYAEGEEAPKTDGEQWHGFPVYWENDFGRGARVVWCRSAIEFLALLNEWNRAGVCRHFSGPLGPSDGRAEERCKRYERLLAGFLHAWKDNMENDEPIPGTDAVDYLVGFYGAVKRELEGEMGGWTTSGTVKD